MNMLGNAKELLTGSPTLPIRKGKRPVTFRGPLHVQCSNHGDDRLLRQLVEEVVALASDEAAPTTERALFATAHFGRTLLRSLSTELRS